MVWGGEAMRHLKRGLMLTLRLALLALVAWAVWRRLGPALQGVRVQDFGQWRPAVGPLVASTIGLTLLHLFQAYLWRRVVIDVGAPPPDARTTVRVYFVAGLARFIPGSLWQFAGLAVLGRESGIPALASAAAGAIGNVVFLGAGVVFLAFTMPGLNGATALFAGTGVAAGLGAAGWLFAASGPGARARVWLARRAPERVRPALELVGRIRPAHALAWTLGYGASWVLLGASFTVFVTAFVPGSLEHFRALSGVMAFAYIGGYIVLFAPAGIGVREGIMGLALVGLVPAPAIVLISLAQRVWFFAAELLALGTFPLLPGRRHGDAGGPGRLDPQGRGGAEAWKPREIQ